MGHVAGASFPDVAVWSGTTSALSVVCIVSSHSKLWRNPAWQTLLIVAVCSLSIVQFSIVELWLCYAVWIVCDAHMCDHCILCLVWTIMLLHLIIGHIPGLELMY